MAKIVSGRISGLDGMESHSAADLHVWADALEAQITDPKNRDDPRYLRRWANKIHLLATQKEKALDHKKKRLQQTVRRLTRR
jgi:cyclopropane fatty-acyl-phospholipid synthase-like methyltransferase